MPLLPPPAEHREGSLADQAIRAWLPEGTGRIAVLAGSASSQEADAAYDAVIAYLAVGDDPVTSLRTALAAARPGATIVFVEPPSVSQRSGAAALAGRALRRRAFSRLLGRYGLAPRRVVLVPSLDRPFLWFDDQAPPHVIRHALGHFGFRQRQRALQSLSFFARDPFVGWWAPSLLHIVIAPPAIS